MRRAVVVLLLIAVVSRAGVQRLHPAAAEADGGAAGRRPGLLPLVGAAAFLATLCGAADPVHRRPADRSHHAEAGVPADQRAAGAGLVAVSYAQGWLVLPIAAVVAAAIFGQVTVNETMTARYISPALRTRMYSVRFFVGFLGAAAAAPVVAWLHERTGSLAAATLVMAGLGAVTLLLRAGVPRPAGGTATRALGRGCSGRGIDLKPSRGAMPGHVWSELLPSPVKADDIALSFHIRSAARIRVKCPLSALRCRPHGCRRGNACHTPSRPFAAVVA